MAVAAWRVWKTHGLAGAPKALGLFFAQLFLNLMWSGLFFGLRETGWAFFELLVLWALILGTTLQFWRKDTWAGILFIPYLLWVTFAGYLNLRIWLLN